MGLNETERCQAYRRFLDPDDRCRMNEPNYTRLVKGRRNECRKQSEEVMLSPLEAYARVTKLLGPCVSPVLILLGNVKEIETSAFGVCKLRVASPWEAVQAA